MVAEMEDLPLNMVVWHENEKEVKKKMLRNNRTKRYQVKI